MAPNTPIYFFEYYPHYMGTLTAEVIFTFAQLQSLHAIAIDPDREDELDDALAAITPVTIYAFRDAIAGDNPEVKDQFAKMLNKFEKGKPFGGMWEEGSYAFSAISMVKAKKKIKKLEKDQLDI